MRLTFKLADDTDVGEADCPTVPRVGEFIWLSITLGDRQNFRVTEVAYWMMDRRVTKGVHDSDHAAIYVEPINREQQ